MQKLIHLFVQHHLSEPIQAIQSVTPGASSRQYFRVKTTNQSYIVSWTADQTVFDNFLNIQSYLHQIHIPVPHILAIDPSHQLILQTDGGNQTLTNVVHQRGVDAPSVKSLYQQAVDIILQMQLASEDQSCVAFSRAFDFEKYWFEYTIHIRKYLLTEWANVGWSVEDHRCFQDFYRQLAHRLAEQPYVFCHRDFQSSNLLVTDADQLIMVDFQDARLGLIQYDLVSLLKDAYVFLPMAFQQELIAYYLTQYQQKTKITIDQDAFMTYYNLALIQRKLHDAGSFARAVCEWGKTDFVTYIPACLRDVLTAIGGCLRNES